MACERYRGRVQIEESIGTFGVASAGSEGDALLTTNAFDSAPFHSILQNPFDAAVANGLESPHYVIRAPAYYVESLNGATLRQIVHAPYPGPPSADWSSPYDGTDGPCISAASQHAQDTDGPRTGAHAAYRIGPTNHLRTFENNDRAARRLRRSIIARSRPGAYTCSTERPDAGPGDQPKPILGQVSADSNGRTTARRSSMVTRDALPIGLE